MFTTLVPDPTVVTVSSMIMAQVIEIKKVLGVHLLRPLWFLLF